MGILQTIAFVIYVIAAILMILAILLQEGKGGGLAGLGGAQAEATFGATNPLRRFTTVMAVIFFFLAGFINYTGKGRKMEIADEGQIEAVSGQEEAPADEKTSEEEGEETGEGREGSALSGETEVVAESEAPEDLGTPVPNVEAEAGDEEE